MKSELKKYDNVNADDVLYAVQRFECSPNQRELGRHCLPNLKSDIISIIYRSRARKVIILYYPHFEI